MGVNPAVGTPNPPGQELHVDHTGFHVLFSSHQGVKWGWGVMGVMALLAEIWGAEGMLRPWPGNKFLLRSWQREPEHLQELRRCCRARPHPMLCPTGMAQVQSLFSRSSFAPPEPGVGSKRRREMPNVTLAPSCSVKSSEERIWSCNPTIAKRPGAEERVRRK